ncbi:hypothetical protein EGW08_020989 [Elysia chlorotica]|uniref:Metalloendopeptidase n=1 Tax=Elysia chlorotica TaxID=188477 RepID=A0A3S1BNP2_ELYCH|nr:hypothetical protein EGW08_020989 [Elysia chlorotica]
MRELTSLTCITFREVDSSYTDKPVLDFMKGYGCWSHVGREQAYPFQEMSVAESCFMKGIILHELGHVIGFWHEQSRPDRDDYVTFVQENVNRRESYNFKMETWGDIDSYGVPYDVGSIMHYGSTSYSKNGEVTLRSKDPLLQRSMGQRERMSFYDIKAANMAYCKDVCSTVTFSCLHDGYPDPKDCSRCRCPDGLHGSRCQAAAPSVESCGGCFPTLQPQVPCLLAKTESCMLKWLAQEYVACPVYFRVLTSACNKYITRQHSRPSVCHREEEQCCTGFQLRDGMCHATEEAILNMGNVDSGTTGDSSGKLPQPQATADPLSGWMNWAPWSTCSASCGGCGRRGRVRNCSKISMCGGKLEDRETQVCNYQPCPKYQAYACVASLLG